MYTNNNNQRESVMKLIIDGEEETGSFKFFLDMHIEGLSEEDGKRSLALTWILNQGNNYPIPKYNHKIFSDIYMHACNNAEEILKIMQEQNK